MDNEVMIKVNNISKSFRVYFDKGNTLKEKALFRSRRKYETRKVLDNISFKVNKGEAIGLIGQNGCGKSTTLKLLTRIMYPDTGSILMNGRVSSLIELGAGFHPDMSGRQNIYINASIFGLTHREIDQRINEIIDFSELGEFIDNPVRTYSSGMYMRLAFSVAINVDADILLIDEILAVGDANFQAKCFNKLREIKAKGTTIVIVSHSLGQIEQICERSIWIHKGKICANGAPYDVHPQYLEFMGQTISKSLDTSERTQSNTDDTKDGTKKSISSKSVPIENNGTRRWGNKKAIIQSIRMTDDSDEEKYVFSTGSNINIYIDYNVFEKVEDADFGIGIFRSDGLRCYGTNTKIEKFPIFDLIKDGCVKISLNKIPLLPGEYWLDIAIECNSTVPVDYITKAVKFQVYATTQDVGIVRMEHEWAFKEDFQWKSKV